MNTGGTSDIIASSSSSGFALLKPDNTVVDAVAVNGYSFTTEVTSSDWSGSINNISGFAGVTRTISDNNTATDWIIASALNLQTISSINPSLSTSVSLYVCPSSRVPIKAMINNYPSIDAGITNLILPSATINGSVNVLVNIKIRNYGLDALFTANINWSINGILQTPFIWNGSLNHGDTNAITISNHLFNSAGTFNIKAWIIEPNGMPTFIKLMIQLQEV